LTGPATRIREARFKTRLRWQFSVKPALARRQWFAHRLPWSVWCRRCASDATTVVGELARRSNMPLTFVQIGSNDGVTNDPLHDTVRASRWSGLVVEPIPSLFDRLTANYLDLPDIQCVNVAIGDVDGNATIYTVDRQHGDPEWVDQIASFDREVLERHSYALPDLENRIVTTEVDCVRLPTLIQRCDVTVIDLFHVDAEGLDDRIVGQIEMDAAWAPRYLIYEKKHLGVDRYRALGALLARSGYRLVDIWPDELAYRAAPSAAS